MKFYEAIKIAALKIDVDFQMSKLVEHSASKGTFREYILRNIIRPFLPKRYGLATGECFDSTGKISRQLDIAVYDDLFSYSIPCGDYSLFPFESIYGVIEVKSFLNKNTFMESINNISSLKDLHREPPGKCQILPNFELEIEGINWKKSGFITPYGMVFAYDSVEPDTIMGYFHEIHSINPALLPEMIVLFKKKTIIVRIQCFEDGKMYMASGNTYGGFLELPCGDDTLPIFLIYLLCRTNDTRIKLPHISDILNQKIDECLRDMGEQRVIKFYQQYNGED